MAGPFFFVQLELVRTTTVKVHCDPNCTCCITLQPAWLTDSCQYSSCKKKKKVELPASEKELLNRIIFLAKLLLVIPATNSSGERFSIKHILRSIMLQERLNTNAIKTSLTA